MLPCAPKRTALSVREDEVRSHLRAAIKREGKQRVHLLLQRRIPGCLVSNEQYCKARQDLTSGVRMAMEPSSEEDAHRAQNGRIVLVLLQCGEKWLCDRSVLHLYHSGGKPGRVR